MPFKTGVIPHYLDGNDMNTSVIKSLTGNDINKFLQEIGGNYISGKSFRTYHANLAFLQKILPSLKTNMIESERKKHCVEIIKQAANELHHLPSTFNNSYLFTPIKELYIHNPYIFKQLFLRISKSLLPSPPLPPLPLLS